MQHTAFFGDGEKTFALTTEMILELERTTGVGIGAVWDRFTRRDYHFGEMMEVIRTGLIGGGMSPVEANELVGIYAKATPIEDICILSFYILDARWNGTPEAPAITQDDLRHAAATGDMTAAINETLKDAGL